MRKILRTAALLLLCASLASCQTVKDKICDFIKIGDKVDTERNGENGAIATLIDADSHSLTLRIENGTDSTWQSGNMKNYHLEAEKDGEWYRVTQVGEFANTLELLIFAPGEKITHTYDFSVRYGTLTPGKYRWVKSWWANETETDEGHEFYLICEFTVE